MGLWLRLSDYERCRAVTALAAKVDVSVQSQERRLLVVDDDPLVLDSIVEYLDDSGYIVDRAGSAVEALNRIEPAETELVVCDLKMPGMDGLTLLGKIRDQWPGVPVVVVSGAGDMDDVVSALRLGASDYLVKPIVNLEVLVHAIERSLAQADLVAQNERYRAQLEQTNAELKRSLRMLEEDQVAARSVQTNMLPAQDVVLTSGIRCQHLLVPSLVLSGDFLDYQAIDESRTFFYMADVSGHGASSALATVLLKSSVLRFFEEAKLDSQLTITPLNLLTRIHQDLRTANLGKFLTCFAGLYDSSQAELTYCVAGHYPRPILCVEQKARFLECSGMPVGLMESLYCEEKTISLRPPFSLHCCSDGVLEVMNALSLSEKEANLLDMAASDFMTTGHLTEIIKSYCLGQHELPDDIALLSISAS